MVKLVRWLLVVPMAALAWVTAFAMSLAVHSVIDMYCPERYLISGACSWEWAMFAQDVLVVAGSSLSAIMFIMTATLTAPAHKLRVAIWAYIIGLSAAIWMLLQTDAWPAFAGASLSGVFVTWIVYRRRSRRSYGDPYQRRLFI